MTSTQVSVAGGRFSTHLWSWGDGGTPLLFLHGFEGHPGEARFLSRLAEKRRVLAPEHPGYGDSTGIEEIDDIIDMTLYYRQLIETLGLAQVDIVGHSLGGMFGAEIAALCPQLVRRLVLVAPFGLWLDDEQIPDLFVMSPNQLQRATWHEPEAPIAQQVLSALAGGKTGPAAIVTRAMNLSAAGKFLWPIPDRGLRKRLPLIKAPTQVIVGASDKLITPGYGRAFADQIPGAQLDIVDAAGHLPMFEQEDRFLRLVEGFLG
jgi:pimeloyl-ACP methyl ester carboxylesterase